MEKRIIYICCLLLTSLASQGQEKKIFIRHDSVLLRAAECNWLIPPNMKADPLLNHGNEGTVTGWLLGAIHRGKIKAQDYYTGEIIPAKEIYSWRMPMDTVAVYNDSFEVSGHKVIQQERQAKYLNQVRVLLDWYLDNNGKFIPFLRGVDLLEEVHTYDGRFIGYRPFCRISY